MGREPEGTSDGARLRSQTARGAKWVLAGQGTRIVLQFVSVAVLARLLTPTDYGLFALALAVVSLGEVFRDFGLSTAAIQAPTLSRGQQSNLMWVNVLIGVVLASVCLLAAPILGALTDHDAATDLLRVMAITFVLNSALAQYRADLNRRLRFPALVSSEIGGVGIGIAAAVASAMAGWGYWSLAVQQVTTAGATLVIAGSLAGWLPRLPDRSEDIRGFLRFGIGMVGTQLVGFANNNIDTLTIGVRFGPTDLGVYNRAYQILMQTLNQLRNPTMTVALPVLSRLKHGTAEMNEMLVRGQLALGYTLVAGAAFAAGAADPIIRVALGPGWDDAIVLFAVLAVAGGFQTVGFVSAWVFVSRGLTGRYFQYSLVSLAIRVTCVIGGSAWGVLGVAVGYAIAPAIALPLSFALLSRWTPLPLRAMYAAAARVVVCAVIAGGATRVVIEWGQGVPAIGQLCMGALTTIGSYAVLALAGPAIRRDLHGVVRFARMAVVR